MALKDLLWRQAEEEFESFFPGKRSFVYAFEDTREAQKTGGSRRIFTKARPSDYLVTHEGVTFFAEVKLTEDPVRFSFGSAIRKEQWASAVRATMAGGDYFFFVKSHAHQKWYRIPATFLIHLFDTQKSLKWEEISCYEYRT